MMNQSQNETMNELERAQQLRREAEQIEYKGRVKLRIQQLQMISKDPYYDQYLAQLLKDLQSGKATPEQVWNETERSYAKYRQRMGSVKPKPEPKKVQQTDSSFEFKIGAHVFSIIGALFVLIAFIIFSFNFLNGLGQGICLYAAAVILIGLSELILRKKMPAFSHVITGIGVGGLYAANISNYLVLQTINSIAALIITLSIGLITILISRKEDSTTIRLISLLGCYICLYPIHGFSSDALEFIVITVMLLVINIIGALFQNQKNKTVINVLHLTLHLIFSIILIPVAWNAGVKPEFLVLYVVASFIFFEVLSFTQCMKENRSLFPFTTVCSSICILALLIIGTCGNGMEEYPEIGLFVRILSETLIITVSVIAFLLWKKEDSRRWGQLYYALGILLIGTFSIFDLETAITVLIALIVIKLLSAKRELLVLDCFITVWAGFTAIGLAACESWYCWLFVTALILSLFRIKWMHIYHEIVITVTAVMVWIFFYYKIFDGIDLWHGWQYPISAVILLLMFLLCNHLPMLKAKKQRAYNITSIWLMFLFYLGVYTCYNYIVSSVMMVLGTASIIIIFRKRYEMELKKKYILLAGFLVYYALTSHYESPVIVSILLMTIALCCVGFGFRKRDKTERICGLVMAMFVCLKLVIYDFREVEVMYRVIVFLVVGIIALIISFIYIQLEKKEDNEKKKLPEGEVSE